MWCEVFYFILFQFLITNTISHTHLPCKHHGMWLWMEQFSFCHLACGFFSLFNVVVVFFLSFVYRLDNLLWETKKKRSKLPNRNFDDSKFVVFFFLVVHLCWCGNQLYANLILFLFVSFFSFSFSLSLCLLWSFVHFH